MNKLILIDGHALIFKMYFAFLRRPMINSKGVDTSILFGFTKYLLELIAREQPTHIAVAFDPPGGTFRNEMYKDYKANRDETPQLVIDSLEPLIEICKVLGVKTILELGYEADDVIGTVAKKYASQQTMVYMVTPDKDYGQLIDENIIQLKPGKAGGEDEIVDINKVCEKYGIISPAQVIEMLTICGDTSDNVPGVKGVGEVGAGKLISKYGSVKAIYEHIGELSVRQQEMFEAARTYIELSHKLVTIKTDVPLSLDLDSMSYSGSFGVEAVELFDKYEFNSLRRYLGKIVVEKVADKKQDYTLVAASELKEEKAYAIMVEGEVITLCSGTKVAEGKIVDLKEMLENKDIIAYDIKSQMLLLKNYGVELNQRLFDVELMHYLIDPEKNHKLDALAKNYLGVSIEDETDSEEKELSLFEQAEPKERNSRSEVAVIYQLKSKLQEEMSTQMEILYSTMEEPLIRVLVGMEETGVKVDLHQLGVFAHELSTEASKLEAKIRQMAEEPNLNVSSPKQVGEILFEKLKLDPKAKKSARGAYSTDETTLLTIAKKHPIVDTILEYRAVKKLLSTYIEPFPSFVSTKTGKVHTTFNQALTATGRLSSSNPNMQNIPIRTERGKEIRKAFIPSSPDGVIMSADYSQIELRLMSYLSCDTHLISAFQTGIDVHSATAAKIFGVEVGEVTADQRRTAKIANFGIMYGISAFGLAQRLGISRTEAKKIIDDYFETFPAIKTYIDDTVAAARENGYVETLFGRRRYLPDINSQNAIVRSLAERNAINAPIQGSSADIIKLAMINVDRRIKEAGLRSRMVLQIHDELLFDTVAEEIDELKMIIIEEMENVIKLSIPLTVECNYGKNWLEAH